MGSRTFALKERTRFGSRVRARAVPLARSLACAASPGGVVPKAASSSAPDAAGTLLACFVCVGDEHNRGSRCEGKPGSSVFFFFCIGFLSGSDVLKQRPGEKIWNYKAISTLGHGGANRENDKSRNPVFFFVSSI